MSGFGHLFGALVFGRYQNSAENSILRLPHCPGCGCPNPSVDHALKSCPRTAHFLTDSGLVTFISRMVSQETFYGILFHSCLEPSVDGEGQIRRKRYPIHLPWNIWHKCRKTWESCCRLNHCGLCPFHFNFRLLLYLFLFIFIRALQRPAGATRGFAQPTCLLHAQWVVSGLLWTMNHEPLEMVMKHLKLWPASSNWPWDFLNGGLVTCGYKRGHHVEASASKT